MLKKLTALLRGETRVRVRCKFPERVLNICAARGIVFWDSAFLGAEELAFCVDRREWGRLKDACAAVDAQVHIERAAGLPFFLGKLRRRRVLSAGLCACAALFLLNTCFIWDLQVEGNETVPSAAILRALAENGVRRGTFVFSFDQRELCNRILPKLPQLAWLTVNTVGCRAHVIVRERIPKPEIVNESAPTNVVAKRDALVCEVRALDGRAMVMKGTTVHKGQLLISGIVDTQGVESPTVATRYLAGKGEVFGRTWYELCAKIPLYELQKRPDGEEKHAYAILWGENRVKFSIKGTGNLSARYDKIISRKQWELSDTLAMPLTWERETYMPYRTVRVERTREAACEQGRELLETELRAMLGADGKVLSSRVSSAVQGEWLVVTLNAECMEQIGREVPIPMQ